MACTERVRVCVHPFMFDPQARERAGLHLSTTTTTTIGGVGGRASAEIDVVAQLRLLTLFFSSSTSESREGVASVECKHGEAQIVVVVVVDPLGAVRSSLL